MKKAKLEIAGMHCASCASNTEKSLSKVPGVKSARVSLMLKKGYVECEDNVREEDLKKAVKKVGYDVKNIEFE